MGGNVLKKLRSSKGASLTFALLAFLVCAVISAVLLASASAAAGRLSGLAEADQRYYAVTSAAQLFCDELSNQEYVIERRLKHTETWKTTYTALSEGGFYEDKSSSPEYSGNEYSLWMKTPSDAADAKVHKITSLTGDRNMAMDLALYYVFGDLTARSANADGATAAVDQLVTLDFADGHGQPGNAAVFNLTMEVMDSSNVADAALTVDVVLTMNPNGTLNIEFTDSTKKFTVVAVMTPKISDNSKNPVETETTSVRNYPDESNSYYELETTVTEKAKTTSIAWAVSEIKKKVSTT